MNKIIAPVDFSEVSINAALYAAQVAATLQKELLLMHIVQLPVVYGDVPMPVGEYDVLMQEAADELAKVVEKITQPTQGNVVIKTSVKVGSPVYEIVQASKLADVYTIVMGTHGAGSVERFFLGSTTQSLINEAACPVIVVPGHYSFSKISNIGYASDFKNVVASTPDATIKMFLTDFNANLQILHVDPDYSEFEPSVMEEGLMLETMFDMQKPSFKFLHSGYVEESILNYAAQNNLDMLMILPKNHSFLESIFKHQHTGQFIRQATVPVMILKAQ